MEVILEEVPEATAHRGSFGRAATYTLATVPATVMAAVAMGWTYGKYTELDRPSAFGVLPFLGASVLWCAAMVVVAYAPHAPLGARRVGAAIAGADAALVVLALIAPATPTSQAAAMLAVAFLTPAAVLSAVDAAGPVAVILRIVVGGIGFVIGVPGALLLIIVVLTRGVPLASAAAIGAVVAHVPVTFLSSVIAGGSGEEPVPVEAGAATAKLRRLAPVTLVAAALIVAGGAATRPLTPAERDPLLAEVAGAHRDLNAAVGWDAWNPDALDGTAARLDRAVVLSDGAPELVDAAAHVRAAVAEGRREDAVIAHRIIAGFERNVRDARDLLAHP